MAGASYVHAVNFPGQREHRSVSARSARCSPRLQHHLPGAVEGQPSASPTSLRHHRLTVYLAARSHLTTKDVSRVTVGAGSTFVAALPAARSPTAWRARPTPARIVAGVDRLHDRPRHDHAHRGIDFGGAYRASVLGPLPEASPSSPATVRSWSTRSFATMPLDYDTHGANNIANAVRPAYIYNGIATRAAYTADPQPRTRVSSCPTG